MLVKPLPKRSKSNKVLDRLYATRFEIASKIHNFEGYPKLTIKLGKDKKTMHRKDVILDRFSFQMYVRQLCMDYNKIFTKKGTIVNCYFVPSDKTKFNELKEQYKAVTLKILKARKK